MAVQQREDKTYSQEEVVLAKDFNANGENCRDIEAEIHLKEQAERSRSRAKAAKNAESDKYQKTLVSTQLYLNEIGFSPLLSAEEEVYFARKALRGEEAARKRMIESNLRLVPIDHSVLKIRRSNLQKAIR